MDEEILKLCKEYFEVREDGLYYKVDRYKCVAGTKVGSRRKTGYPLVKLCGRMVYVHHIVFQLYYGYLPEFIDHIDKNKLNHAPSNLRAVTHEQNMHNLPCHDNENTGIYVDKRNGRFLAGITVNNKKVHIGSYGTREEAIAARKEYAAKVWN